MGININDKKIIIATALGTFTFCAFFLARGTTRLVAASVFPLNTAVVSVGSTISAETTIASGSEIPDVKKILARNIFDSTTGPLWPLPSEIPVNPRTNKVVKSFVPDPKNPPPLCEESKVKLLASIYSEAAPEWSFVSLSLGSDSPLLYRPGGEIDGHKVLAVYPKMVYLEPPGGKACSCLMFGQEAYSSAKTPTASVSEKPSSSSTFDRNRRSSGGLSIEEMDKNITRESDTKFTIQRALIDKVLANQIALMRSARIVPHERNGQVEGVRLYGIHENSLLGKLGLQNGDLLRSINGYDMTSPDAALEAYSRLRSANNLAVSIQRRRKDMNFSYGIE